MKPISIVIPIRINYEKRKRNLNYILKELLAIPYVHVDILESDATPKLNPEEHSRLRYTFIENHDPFFHRTKYINWLLRNAEYNIVGVWDADIIVGKKQIEQAAHLIRQGATLSLPYDGRCRYISDIESLSILEGSSKLHKESGMVIIKRPAFGGAFMVNREKYLKLGGENENFVDWGPEDFERIKRLEMLNQKISRTNGCFYHLYHERNYDMSADELFHHNQKKLFDLCALSPQNLIKSIKNKQGEFSYLAS